MVFAIHKNNIGKNSMGCMGVMCLVLCLQACGQKGDLYLPQSQSTTTTVPAVATQESVHE